MKQRIIFLFITLLVVGNLSLAQQTTAERLVAEIQSSLRTIKTEIGLMKNIEVSGFATDLNCNVPEIEIKKTPEDIFRPLTFVNLSLDRGNKVYLFGPALEHSGSNYLWLGDKTTYTAGNMKVNFDRQDKKYGNKLFMLGVKEIIRDGVYTGGMYTVGIEPNEANSFSKEYCQEFNSKIGYFKSFANGLDGFAQNADILKTVEALNNTISNISEYEGDRVAILNNIKTAVEQYRQNLAQFHSRISNSSNEINFSNAQELAKLAEVNGGSLPATLNNIVRDLKAKNWESLDKQSELAAKQSERVSEQLNTIFSVLTPGSITAERFATSVAVFPSGIFGQSASKEGYEAINPLRFLEEIKKFLLRIAPELFVLLVIIGGIYYLLGVFGQGNIETGKKYVIYAAIGYFLLLVATVIISLVQFLFGAP